MSDKAIAIDGLSIRFNLAREKIDNVKEYALKKLKNELRFDEFYALKNVSFSVDKGDSFAIIGENGCGKSTLLKAISGIYYPDSGYVRTEGKISPLIELGAGFDMDLTARENIFLNGALLGYSKKFISEHFDEIADFSELRDFLDAPLKNFSSGMVARLGFSIATAANPDILIVDEILAVGDVNFRKKCEKRMEEMLSLGTTLLFVSHDIDQVKDLCRHAIWLSHGEVIMLGDTEKVTDAYLEAMKENKIPKPKEKNCRSEKEAPKAEKLRPHFPFIAWLHAIAALMVLYHHVFEVHFTSLGIENAVISFVRRHVIVPFRIDFGYLGVVIFFIVSGFLNTESLSRSSPLKYLFKKAKRIFPTLFVAVAGLWFFQFAVGKISGAPTYWAQFTFPEWLEAATLVGHFTGVSEKIIGVTWFLVPLLIYCILSALLRDTALKYPLISLSLKSLFVAVFSFGLSYLGGLWFSFANYIQHIPLILLGEVIYLAYKKLIGKKSAIFLFILNFALLSENVRLFLPENYFNPEAVKGPSAVMGIAVFALFFLFGKTLPEIPPVTFIDKLSLVIYLTHYQTAQLIIEPLASLGNISSSLLALIYLASALGVAVIEYSLVKIISKIPERIKKGRRKWQTQKYQS